MKTLLASAFALALCGATSVQSPSQKVTGDYLEVRTASVFTGACHYNGELVTIGREAVMAWNFKSGSHNGVDLAGVRAAAAIASEANLMDEKAARRLELVIDSSATDAQAKAVASLLADKNLGQVVAVRRAPVTFTQTAQGFAVQAPGLTTVSVQPLPNGECCKQPNLVWYSPLVPLIDRKVGYTQSATATPTKAGAEWKHEGENSAFYGSFSF